MSKLTATRRLSNLVVRVNIAGVAVSNDSCRNAHHHGIVGHVFRHDCTSPNVAIRADRDPWEHRCVASNGRIIAHPHEPVECCRTHDMNASTQDAFMTDRAIRVEDAEISDDGEIVDYAARKGLYPFPEADVIADDRGRVNSRNRL